MNSENTDVIDDVNDSSKGVSGAETNIIPKKINRAIKNGWQAGIVIFVLTLCLFVYQWIVFKASWWDLADVAIYLLLSYGVYRRSRTCAILMLFLYILSQAIVPKISYIDNVNTEYHFNILLIILITGFSYGVVGTIEFHRWRKGKKFNDKKITKYMFACAVASFLLLLGIMKGTEWMMHRITPAQWAAVDEDISKTKSSYPLKLNNEIIIKDVYRNNNVLTYEYTLTDVKKEDFTRLNIYRLSLPAFKNMCNQPIIQLYNMKVEYLFMRGLDQISLTFDKGDCPH